jgi:hypothetical protein
MTGLSCALIGLDSGKTLSLSRVKVLGLGLIVILLCGAICASALILHASETTDALDMENGNVPDPISAKAAGFLLNYTYDATMGLCSEVYGLTGNSLHFNGSVFWICSDNMLTWYALQDYDETVSDTIKNTIEAYAEKYSLPRDSKGLPIDFKHEVIWGDTLPDRVPYGFNLPNLIATPSYIVASEVDNRSDAPWNNWYNYSDECAWMGMSYLNKGDVTDALACYNNMTRFWDGYGFADAAYSDPNAPQYGYYEPFKLALAIIFRERLGLPKPSSESTMERILAACQGPDGGIATGYDKNLSTRGHIEDTETTALVVIADIGQPVKAGVFYYVWYQGVYGSGHWNGTLGWTVIDTPLLGFYNSDDVSVIRQHLDWFEELGISFLIISWWGASSLGVNDSIDLFTNEVTNTIFQVISTDNYPIQVALMVEGFNESYIPGKDGTYNITAIYDYIYDTYYSKYPNIFLKLYGRPLVCWWNQPNMTGDPNPNLKNIQQIHNDTRFVGRIIGHHSYVDWQAWRPCSANSSETPVFNPNDGVVIIEPRYDGSHIGQGAGSVFDPTYSQGLYDSQWNYVLHNMDEINYVIIYSWNEYHERSEIEPHIGPDGEYVLLPFAKTYHYIQTMMVPEFPSLLILPPFMMVSLLVVMVQKRKGHKSPIGEGEARQK